MPAVSTRQALRTERQEILMSDSDKVEQAELDRYGIERVPADQYVWAGYRYSNARDALAAAKRSTK